MPCLLDNTVSSDLRPPAAAHVLTQYGLLSAYLIICLGPRLFAVAKVDC